MSTNRTYKYKKQKWSKSEQIYFFEKLDLYLSSGLSLAKAFEYVLQGSKKKHTLSIQNMKTRVETGDRFALAMAHSLKMKSSFVTLLSNGEQTGQLSKSISQCKVLLEKEDEIIKKCLSALTYPVVIFIFALVLTMFLIRGIMPQITPMLLSLHTHLPLVTRLVMKSSTVLVSYGIYIGLAIVFLCGLFTYLYSSFNKFTYVVQLIILKTPIIGSLYLEYTLSLYLYSLGSLVESGISVHMAYKESLQGCNLLPLKKALLLRQPEIERGVSLGTLFLKLKEKNFGKIPSFVGPLLNAGEVSGTLGLSALRNSVLITKNVENSLRKLTALLEPLLMVGVGGMVGTIAVAIMMPIYDISKVLQK